VVFSCCERVVCKALELVGFMEEGLGELELHLRHPGFERERTHGFFIGRETKDFFFFLLDGVWLDLSLALEALGAGRHRQLVEDLVGQFSTSYEWCHKTNVVAQCIIRLTYSLPEADGWPNKKY
jgi:hypothetical protein